MYELEWEGVVEVGRKAAGLDVTLHDDTSLMTGAVALSEAISGLETALAHVSRELDTRLACERDSAMSVGSWLARETHLPRRRTYGALATGRGLRDLPAIDDAVTDGRLTIEHAAHLARRCTPRVLDAVVLVQDQIIDWATDCSFEVWARHVSALIELLDEDGPHDPDRDEPRAELTIGDALDGIIHLTGAFGGADAVLVRQAIDTKADELFHRAKRDRDHTGGATDIPPRPVLRAMALVELCRLANARDIASSKAPRPDITLIVRATEPLHDQPANNEPRNDEPRNDGPTNDEDLDNPRDHDNNEAGAEAKRHDDGERDDRGRIHDLRSSELDRGVGFSFGVGLQAPGRIPVPMLDPLRPAVSDLNGVRLQDTTTRALLCDPDIHPLIVNSLGVPLDLGRSARYANDDQRRALTIRDGGCIFPGCDRPPGWCDAHHVTRYNDGGLTDLELLALLCRRHHGITHRHGWTMHTTADQWFWWTTPNGTTFWSQRHGHQRAGPTPT